MYLGVILMCLSAEVNQCQIMVNTEALYPTEQACIDETGGVAYSINQRTGLATQALCYKFNALGQPV